MSRTARWALALALLPIAACSHREMAANTPPANPQPPAPQLSATDSTFIDQAAMSGLDEVQDGQLGATQASRAAVREFAQRMVADHTKANQQLAQIASQKGVTPPTQSDQQQTAERDALRHMHGRTFDSHFIQDQVRDHQQSIQLFQQEAEQGTDPDLKAFAQQTLPILQQHLQMAESLEGRHATGRAARKHRQE
jgi:putative membrane protein